MFSRRSDCSTIRSRSFLDSLPFFSKALRKVDRRIAASGWLLTASSASFSLALAPISSFCSGIVFVLGAFPSVPLTVTAGGIDTVVRTKLNTPNHSRCSNEANRQSSMFILGQVRQERVLYSHLPFFEVFRPAAFLGFGLPDVLPPGLFPPP